MNQAKQENGAVGYIRVSKPGQVQEGVSLDAQEARIRAYCQMAGLELVALIREEGVSGAKPLSQRPGGKELLSIVGARGARHVVALKLDRLFRDAVDALSQTNAWDKAGLSLHLVDVGGGTLNTTSAMGRMFLTMMAAYAEFERALTAERTKAALQHEKRRGELVGSIPYGQRLDADGVRLLPDPAEQKVIATVLEFHGAGLSLRGISQRLKERGFTARGGGAFHPQTVSNILAARREQSGAHSEAQSETKVA